MVDAWATADDVLRLTGEQVGDGDLIRAQDIIEILAGVTFDSVELSPRNLRLLNRAVAYQAAWAVYHPDLYSHVDVDNVSQDGHSHTPSHDLAALVAPLAHLCLKRLSWVQKPLRVRPRYGQSDYNELGSRDSAAADDARVWMPL